MGIFQTGARHFNDAGIIAKKAPPKPMLLVLLWSSHNVKFHLFMAIEGLSERSA